MDDYSHIGNLYGFIEEYCKGREQSLSWLYGGWANHKINQYEGRKAVEIILAIYESSEKGRPVYL